MAASEVTAVVTTVAVVGRQFRIADCVLDIFVPHPGLDRPSVVAGVRKRIAATVA
jgi:hypothetical protein